MTLVAQIAKEANMKEENIINLKVEDGIADFQEKGYSKIYWYVKLTPTGKVKKNSLRRNRN